MAALFRAAVVAQVPVLALVEAAPVVLAQLAVPALLARLLDLADLVVEVELLVHLLSRQSFSAAMARTTPQRTAPYEQVPKSR